MPTITLSDTELAEVIRGLGLVSRQYEQDAANCASGSVRGTFEEAARFCDELAARLKTHRRIPPERKARR